MRRKKQRSKHHRSKNNNWRYDRIVPGQRQIDQDRFWPPMWEIEYREQYNKMLFKMAEFKVCWHFKDCTVRTYFGDIKLEILHLIPRYPHLAPELLLLRVLERKSVLLGRIDRFCPYAKTIYIRDVEDGEICFRFEGNGECVKPGRFIAIQNPRLHIFEDDKLGFCVEDEKRVIFIFTDNDYKLVCIVVVIVFLISILIMLFYQGSKKY